MDDEVVRGLVGGLYGYERVGARAHAILDGPHPYARGRGCIFRH